MEFPIQMFARWLLMALEGRKKRYSIQPRWSFHFRHIGHRWQEIPESDHGVTGRSCGDDAGPARQEGNANTSFVQIPFDSVEGAIAVEELRIVSSLFMWSVIAGEKDQRTALKTRFDKLFHQAADIAVHASDHRREVLLELRPVAVSIRAIVGDFHSIAGEVAKLVVGVWCRVRQHDEERRPVRLLQEIQTSLREQIRRVLFALIEPIAREEILVLILPENLRIVIVSMLLIEIAEEGIESARVRNTSCGRAAKSPFPEHRRLVSGALQKIRGCDVA